MTVARRSWFLALGFLVLASSLPAQSIARGKLAGADDARAYADALKQVKSRVLDVAWKDVRLEDAIKELRIHLGRAILFAPAAEDRKETPVAIELHRVSAASLLRVIESYAKVRFLFESGVVFVTTPEDAVKRSLVMRVYDVSDLMYQPPDFPAPQLTLHPGKPLEPPQETDGGKRDTAEIIDLIKLLVGPEVWEVEGTGIAISGRLLVVTHTPEVQAKVRRFVDSLAAFL